MLSISRRHKRIKQIRNKSSIIRTSVIRYGFGQVNQNYKYTSKQLEDKFLCIKGIINDFHTIRKLPKFQCEQLCLYDSSNLFDLHDIEESFPKLERIYIPHLRNRYGNVKPQLFEKFSHINFFINDVFEEGMYKNINPSKSMLVKNHNIKVSSDNIFTMSQEISSIVSIIFESEDEILYQLLENIPLD